MGRVVIASEVILHCFDSRAGEKESGEEKADAQKYLKTRGSVKHPGSSMGVVLTERFHVRATYSTESP